MSVSALRFVGTDTRGLGRLGDTKGKRMNPRSLLGVCATMLAIAGCTQMQTPDGSVTTIIGPTPTPTPTPEVVDKGLAGGTRQPDAPKIVDNRELHINSHNSSEPALVGASNQILNNRLASQIGLNGLDSTVFIPSRYLQETPESKKVQAGASQFAMAKGCMFMQRYRIAINADFTGTLNLMKYRAAGMGAEWINVQFHAESTPFERLTAYGVSLFLVDGTQTLENQIFTVLEADLFDCG